MTVEQVPIGVPAEDAPEEAYPLPERPTIAFVGRLNWAPNETSARVLCETVLPIVLRSVPDARVVLAGASPSSSVESLAGPSVEIHPDPPDVLAELRQVTVAAFPGGHGWGIRGSVLQALRAGTPVVVSEESARGIGLGDQQVRWQRSTRPTWRTNWWHCSPIPNGSRLPVKLRARSASVGPIGGSPRSRCFDSRVGKSRGPRPTNAVGEAPRVEHCKVAITVCTYQRPAMWSPCRLGAMAAVIEAERDAPHRRGRRGRRRSRWLRSRRGRRRGKRLPHDDPYDPLGSRNLSSARNRALELGVGLGADWVAMIDDDTSPGPSWLGELLAVQALTDGTSCRAESRTGPRREHSAWARPRRLSRPIQRL